MSSQTRAVQTTLIDSTAMCPRGPSDVPLRTKFTLLVLLAAVAGCLVGMVESHLGYQVWPLAMGLSLVIGSLWWLSHVWAWQPIDRLIRLAQRLGRSRRARSLAKLPLGRHDEVGQLARAMYALVVSAKREHREARHLRRILDHRIEQATRQATQQLHQMAMRDPLTDLGNRRFLDDNLPTLLRSVKESNADLICVLLDMDNFKLVNDTLGHAAGDELLVFLASLIRGCTRHGDHAIRLGGDEFVILMAECEWGRVQQFTTQLRTLFRQHAHIALPPQINTDLSMGVASSQRDQIDRAQELLKRADENLYAAKRNGKGCSVGV